MMNNIIPDYCGQELTLLPVVSMNNDMYSTAEYYVMLKRIRWFMEHNPDLLSNLEDIKHHSKYFRSSYMDEIRIDVFLLPFRKDTPDTVMNYSLTITLYNNDYCIDFKFVGPIINYMLADGVCREDDFMKDEFMEFLMDYTNIRDYIDEL